MFNTPKRPRQEDIDAFCKREGHECDHADSCFCEGGNTVTQSAAERTQDMIDEARIGVFAILAEIQEGGTGEASARHSLMKMGGFSDRERYVVRQWCGYAKKDGVRGEMDANGFHSAK